MKSYQEALDFLIEQAQTTQQIEQVSLFKAYHRVLAQDVVSTMQVPPADNSMMDGYGIAYQDFAGEGTKLTVSQRIAAGEVGETLQSGTAVRIFTGAQIPKGVDTVIMQEHVSADGDHITLNEPVSRGQNIRVAGEDIEIDQVILKKGQRLRPQDIALAASIGVDSLSVYKPLKVATFSTGDELVMPGEALTEGKIYNANRFTLVGYLNQMGFEVIDLGQVEDTLEATQKALQKAAEVADVMITSGGVSVGEEDHLKPAVDSLGELNMWKVKMKPGKPLAYGHVQNTPFIGLPGNPVSTFATFILFAKPYLMRMQGMSEVAPSYMTLPAGFDWPKAGFRREFARARLETVDGRTQIVLFPNQSSGVLTSASWAEGLAEIPDETTVKAGDLIRYYPLSENV